MKILIDMNLSSEWVQVFKKDNIQSIHWSNVGDSRATDREIMDWALSHNYEVIIHYPLSIIHCSLSIVEQRSPQTLAELIAIIICYNIFIVGKVCAHI